MDYLNQKESLRFASLCPGWYTLFMSKHSGTAKEASGIEEFSIVRSV